MNLEVANFGCRLNAVESEAIGRLGLPGDLLVVNSCAVTAEAVRDARKAVRRGLAAGRRVVVTGCAAETERFEGVWMVPNLRKADLSAYVEAGVTPSPAQAAPESPLPQAGEGEVWPILPLSRLRERRLAGGGPRAGEGVPSASTLGSRAFVAIQNGCDHRCTFCIIPYGRGASRSEPAAAVVARIRELADTHREVVLTGVDLTDWREGALRLGDLVLAILDGVSRLERLRLSSLDSVEIDPLLLDLIGSEPRLMPHLHLSLQAGDDMVLKRMKRRHARADAVRIVADIKARRPEVAIGADLIAGFPTETDAMFANTLALIADCDIVHAHIFPYSEREGTPAARMPQVAPQLRRERAARLRAAAAERRSQWLRAQIGSVQPVLVERGGSGHTPGFAPVRIDGAPGSVVRARIDGVDADKLTAVAA